MTFPDGPPVPLLAEGLLDADALARLLEELVVHTTITSILVKDDPQGHATGSEREPATVCDRLLAGTARRVQVRYFFDGSEWADTILAGPGGFRVVRCQLSGGTS